MLNPRREVDIRPARIFTSGASCRISGPKRVRQSCSLVRLSVWLLSFDEFENVKPLYFPTRKKAVDGSLFVIEDLKDGAELGKNQQLGAAFREVQQFQCTAGGQRTRVAHDETAEAAAVDVIEVRHVKNNVFDVGGEQAIEACPKSADLIAGNKSALETENCYPFDISLLHLKRHGVL